MNFEQHLFWQLKFKQLFWGGNLKIDIAATIEVIICLAAIVFVITAT